AVVGGDELERAVERVVDGRALPRLRLERDRAGPVERLLVLDGELPPGGERVALEVVGEVGDGAGTVELLVDPAAVVEGVARRPPCALVPPPAAGPRPPR